MREDENDDDSEDDDDNNYDDSVGGKVWDFVLFPLPSTSNRGERERECLESFDERGK